MTGAALDALEVAARAAEDALSDAGVAPAIVAAVARAHATVEGLLRNAIGNPAGKETR